MPYIDYPVANKCFFSNIDVTHLIKQKMTPSTQKTDGKTYCKMVFNLLLFLYSSSSEMTGLKWNHTLFCSPVCGLDMSLCRHLLASMEGQDAQYKLCNGSPTLFIWLPLKIHLCSRMSEIQTCTKPLTYQDTKPFLTQLV